MQAAASHQHGGLTDRLGERLRPFGEAIESGLAPEAGRGVEDIAEHGRTEGRRTNRRISEESKSVALSAERTELTCRLEVRSCLPLP